MNREKFLKLTTVGSLGLFLGIKLPEAEAVEQTPVFVSKPLTKITVGYMGQPWRIPFGPSPPLNPKVGDRWWRLGKYGHYEVTKFNGRSWER